MNALLEEYHTHALHVKNMPYLAQFQVFPFFLFVCFFFVLSTNEHKRKLETQHFLVEFGLLKYSIVKTIVTKVLLKWKLFSYQETHITFCWLVSPIQRKSDSDKTVPFFLISYYNIQNPYAMFSSIAVSISTVTVYYTLKYYMHGSLFSLKKLPWRCFGMLYARQSVIL